MEFKTTDRGFKHMEPVDTEFGQVRVYESSNAEQASIWLSVTNQRFSQGAEEKAVTQLTLEQAQQLAAQLTWLIANHYWNGVDE